MLETLDMSRFETLYAWKEVYQRIWLKCSKVSDTREVAVESHIFAYIIQYPTVDVMSDVVCKHVCMYSIFVSLLSVFLAKSIGGKKKKIFQ